MKRGGYCGGPLTKQDRFPIIDKATNKQDYTKMMPALRHAKHHIDELGDFFKNKASSGALHIFSSHRN